MTTKLIARMLIVAAAVIPGPAARAQVADTAQLKTVVVSASKVPKPASSVTQPVTVLLGRRSSSEGSDESDGCAARSSRSDARAEWLVRSADFALSSRRREPVHQGADRRSAGECCRRFFDFSHLTTDNIDRIEIVRGPASVLYGADAVSGIVQIFTRKGSGDPRASIAARAGTYQSLDLVADAAGSTRLGGFSVGAAQHSTDGILPFNNEYRNGTLSTSLALGESATGDARISARYTAAEFHYPTDFTGQPVDSNSYRTQHRLTVGFDGGRNLTSNVQVALSRGKQRCLGSHRRHWDSVRRYGRREVSLQIAWLSAEAPRAGRVLSSN